MTETLLNIWYVMVDFVSFLFGVWLETASWILISFFLLIIILLILVFLFKKFNKKILSFKKKLIFEYDNIFYLLASAQYKKEIDKTSMWWDPCIAAIKPIISMENPSYLANRRLIKENVGKVEKLLWYQIIEDWIWKKINIFYTKLKTISLLYKILKILFVIIILLVIGSLVYVFAF